MQKTDDKTKSDKKGDFHEDFYFEYQKLSTKRYLYNSNIFIFNVENYIPVGSLRSASRMPSMANWKMRDSQQMVVYRCAFCGISYCPPIQDPPVQKNKRTIGKQNIQHKSQ